MRTIITQLYKIISLLLVIGISTCIAMVDFPEPPMNFPTHFLTVSHLEIMSVLSPDGTKKAGVLDDHAIQIWNVKTHKIDSLLQDSTTQNNKAHDAKINSVKFSTDGTKLVTASDDETVKIWNVLNGQWIHTLKGHTDAVITAIFNTDNTKISTFSSDKTVKVWDVETGTLLETLSMP